MLRLGGMQGLGLRVIESQSPTTKIIENRFNFFQRACQTIRGQIGRKRGEMERENKIWTACRLGHRDPRDYFLSFEEGGSLGGMSVHLRAGRAPRSKTTAPKPQSTQNMKPLILILALLMPVCAFSQTPGAQEKAPTLPKVVLTNPELHLHAYPLSDPEILVNGGLIKRITVGKTSAVITYLNTNELPRKPDYTFRIFNAYGMEVGSFGDHWALATIPNGETKTETKNFRPIDLDRYLQFAKVKLPEDWRTPVYLLIEGAQP